MAGKKKKKELEVGDVACVVSAKVTKDFLETEHLRHEAQEILKRCAAADSKAWADILRKHKLPTSNIYNLNYSTDEVTVIRKQ